MNSQPYTVGTIVLIKFPFAEAPNHKVRPAIIVNADLPQALLVLYITSNTSHVSDFDVTLEPSSENNLQKTSVARVNRLTVAAVQDVVRPLGQLSPVEHSRLKESLQQLAEQF